MSSDYEPQTARLLLSRAVQDLMTRSQCPNDVRSRGIAGLLMVALLASSTTAPSVVGEW